MVNSLRETQLMHGTFTKVQEYIKAWCRGQHQQGRGKVNLMTFPIEGRELGKAVKLKAQEADYLRSYNMLTGDSNTSINKFTYTKDTNANIKKGLQDSLALFFNTKPTEGDDGEQIWNPTVLILIHDELGFMGSVNDKLAEEFFSTLLKQPEGDSSL